MTAEEAALELKDHENTFLVFRNAENEQISVIYTKKNGDYGLIEP
jgi:putative sigma-54 modulation protein